MADLLSLKLSAFLLAQAGKPFVWGKSDCGLLVADWILWAKGGPDPAASIRGTYSNQAGAEAILAAVGGFTAHVGLLVEAAGCVATESPQDGDIGVIDMPKTGLTGAVMTNGAWAFRTGRGMAWSKAAPGRLVKAWSLDA